MPISRGAAMLAPTESPDPSSPARTDDLPDYNSASTSRRSQHTYTIDRSGRPWLTWNVNSQAAKPADLPYFFGFTPITGSVVLDLNKPEYITSISIEVEGRCIPREGVYVGRRNQNMSITFLKNSTPVWNPSPGRGTFLDILARQEGEKLEGRHAFDFSVVLPETVDFPLGAEYGVPTFPLPATFSEVGTRAGVFYEIAVVVGRGKLSVNNLIIQRFRWAPAIEPPPFFGARRKAYASGTATIPDVTEDPDGWETLDPVIMTGEVFGQRQVRFEYTLSLAKPLSYTRGSVIPLSLLVKCSDEQALDLLSTADAPIAKLLCHVHYISHTKTKQGGAQLSTTVKGPVDMSFDSGFRTTQSATWWISEEVRLSGRRLRGEIHIKPSLKPGLLTPEFRLFYTVGLFAPRVPALVISDKAAKQGGSRRKPLVSREIEVATLYAHDCPRPIAVTPPTYEKDEPTMVTLFSQ